ncbi:hypothetical protein PsorP6_009472 [Peronosclerospora sorghi]|uniref:Uncharacterized protein n=1 Tax=Peronosclerospora sorghi TaxID=230839 RepID=A0ACC0VZY7_9STRA|nr:hypothetical protein PsorP6_009472 [Peronosclerospora sorghi]
MELSGKTHKQAVMEATEKQQLIQCQVDSAVQQMKSVREEMSRMKRVLETPQENYERELQLNAAEKRLEEVLEAKTALVEQNSLLHSQLEHGAAQVRRAHDQELLKGMDSRANQEAGEG